MQPVFTTLDLLREFRDFIFTYLTGQKVKEETLGQGIIHLEIKTQETITMEKKLISEMRTLQKFSFNTILGGKNWQQKLVGERGGQKIDLGKQNF